MTAVICWFDDSGWPWIVADSRFSYPSESSQQILIDEGAKIFSFPLIVRKTWGFGEPIHFANIGLAFAGSTLVAQNTILCTASVCGNLVLQDIKTLLSLDHIAEQVAKFSLRFMRDLAVLRGSEAGAEFALTGWCPFRNAWRIFHIRPVIEDGLQIRIKEFIPSNADDLLLLGDHQIEVQEEVAKVRADYEASSLPWWRAPSRALLRILERRQFGSIGGHLQIGIAAEATKGFSLSTVVHPGIVGQTHATVKFLGMDTKDDIGAIGPCFLGMGGMPIL